MITLAQLVGSWHIFDDQRRPLGRSITLSPEGTWRRLHIVSDLPPGDSLGLIGRTTAGRYSVVYNEAGPPVLVLAFAPFVGQLAHHLLSSDTPRLQQLLLKRGSWRWYHILAAAPTELQLQEIDAAFRSGDTEYWQRSQTKPTH